MNSKFDVAIVGSGPGGAAAAIWAAKCGLRAVLLEAQSFPRDRPGETLHPGVEPLFIQLGVLEDIHCANFHRHSGHWVDWGREPHFQPFGSGPDGLWLGFQATGAELDLILMRRAQSLGVTVLAPFRAVRTLISDGRVAGVGGVSAEFPARFTIDGTGRLHWLAKSLDISLIRESPELRVRYRYVQGKREGLKREPVICCTPQGWTWIAPIRPALFSWTSLNFNAGNVCAPDQLLGLDPVGHVRGADVTWRLARQCAGPGFFIVGDAASVMDPSGSHGVLKAIMSGILAADLISRICRGLTLETTAAATFHEWTEQWHRSDAKELAKWYVWAGCNKQFHLRH